MFHFTLAAVLRHGWDEKEWEATHGQRDLKKIHELGGHETVVTCLRILRQCPNWKQEVYCEELSLGVTLTSEKLLRLLCRMRREGRVAYDVMRLPAQPAQANDATVVA